MFCNFILKDFPRQIIHIFPPCYFFTSSISVQNGLTWMCSISQHKNDKNRLFCLVTHDIVTGVTAAIHYQNYLFKAAAIWLLQTHWCYDYGFVSDMYETEGIHLQCQIYNCHQQIIPPDHNGTNGSDILVCNLWD